MIDEGEIGGVVVLGSFGDFFIAFLITMFSSDIFCKYLYFKPLFRIFFGTGTEVLDYVDGTQRVEYLWVAVFLTRTHCF